MKFSLKGFRNSQVWMSHSDSIKALPANGVKLASTHDVEFAAYKIEGETTCNSIPPKFSILRMDQNAGKLL
jgi:GMP synthase-like glutamine amidotransferase